MPVGFGITFDGVFRLGSGIRALQIVRELLGRGLGEGWCGGAGLPLIAEESTFAELVGGTGRQPGRGAHRAVGRTAQLNGSVWKAASRNVENK